MSEHQSKIVQQAVAQLPSNKTVNVICKLKQLGVLKYEK